MVATSVFGRVGRSLGARAGGCGGECTRCKSGGLCEFCGSPEDVLLTAVMVLSVSEAWSTLSEIFSGHTHL